MPEIKLTERELEIEEAVKRFGSKSEAARQLGVTRHRIGAAMRRIAWKRKQEA